MTIYKCDVCKKTIKDRQQKIVAGVGGSWADTTFCERCGDPIKRLFIKHKLLERKGTFGALLSKKFSTEK